MKAINYFILTIIIAFTVACGQQTTTETVIPEDLAGKKQLLSTKRSELKSLETMITQLEADIEKLEPTKEKPKRLVTTTAIERKDFKHFVEIQGNVEAEALVGASSEVGGRLINMTAKEGQAINKGALIATVDMEQLDKQIAEIRTSLELADQVFERQERLWKQNIGSEIQYLQAKNNKERLEKSLETIQFQTTKANVYAPISGVVERVNVKTGEVASPGMPIVQILDTKKLKVNADVPEIYLRAVKRGDKVKVNIPAIELELDARITQIGRTVNPANRTFIIEIDLPRKDILKPNLLATVAIQDAEQKDVVLLPLELVQQEVSGQDYVYIKAEGKEGSFAKKVYVTTGDSFNGEIVIESGLDGTEELIVDGARILTNNEAIKVQNALSDNQ